MRSPLIISCVLAFLLSACTTSSGYQQQMQHWQGKNIQTLERAWGKPDSSVTLPNGHVLYQYTRKNFVSIPDPKRQPFKTTNNTLFTSYEEPWLTNQTMVRYCRTTFETNRCGTIIRTNFTGNNCVGYRFFR